jgi:hypothetical protein
VGSDPSAVLIALGTIGLLVLVLRWVFAPSRPFRARRPVDATEAELGLLTVVASGLPRQDAMAHRAVLGAAEIRSSMSRRQDGTFDVLVFNGDVNAARILLGP